MYPYTEETARIALSTSSFGVATDNTSDLEEDNLSDLPSTSLFHSALQGTCQNAVRIGPKSPVLQFQEDSTGTLEKPNIGVPMHPTTSTTSSRTPRTTTTPSSASTSTPTVGTTTPRVRFGLATTSVQFGLTATTATTAAESPPQTTTTTVTAAAATIPTYLSMSDTAVDTGAHGKDQEEFHKLHLEIRKDEIRKFLTSGSVSKNLHDRLELFSAKPVTPEHVWKPSCK